MNDKLATVYPSSVRDAMSRWPTGIAVITTADQEGWRWGCTADSFGPVSTRPPMVSVCLARENRCRPAFAAADVFAVNVLRDGQEELARQFACPEADAFVDAATEPGIEGVPLLCDVSVRMECRTTSVVPAGDHVMLLGEVLRVRTGPGEPLVYLHRHFRRLHRVDPLPAAAGF
ncbi:flavin reductase family protein [Actinophytocola sp.]|uniref:flavin reductase family protein n=1 Tax=Actinophytocola sp. TaxID=1872138 RepID=UPI002D80A28B|nr:flavin reductase family protein [Actinophytocola sp.]HET9138085.1 flavin reductase family protein [Actinophytocola sp.]HEU5110457.1 flavin reductase family protein [Micromonosporaceae bacterium]